MGGTEAGKATNATVDPVCVFEPCKYLESTKHEQHT
jgi:hypothetical protein